MNWITSRIKEKSSQGGVALIAMGLVVIFLGGFVNIAAMPLSLMVPINYFQRVNHGS